MCVHTCVAQCTGILRVTPAIHALAHQDLHVIYVFSDFHFLTFRFGDLFARLTQINLVYLRGSFTFVYFFLCLYYTMIRGSSQARMTFSGVTLVTIVIHKLSTGGAPGKSDPRRGHLLLFYEVSSRTEVTNSPLH